MELIVIIIWLLIGWACAETAKAKNRSYGGWFALGVLFGFISLIIVALLPPLPHCNCGHCDHDCH